MGGDWLGLEVGVCGGGIGVGARHGSVMLTMCQMPLHQELRPWHRQWPVDYVRSCKVGLVRVMTQSGRTEAGAWEGKGPCTRVAGPPGWDGVFLIQHALIM